MVEEALEDYSNSIQLLKQECTDAGMTEDEFKNLYLESLNDLQKHNLQTCNRNRVIFTKRRSLVLCCIVLLLITYNIKSIHSNLQEYIHPGLKVLRRISIPFISLFPSLTEFYHETCLIQNPFFTVVDMECWPCSSINNVHVIDDPGITKQQNAPFIYKTDQKVMNIGGLSEIYARNKEVFDKESPKILTKSNYHVTPSGMFYSLADTMEKNLFIWKFNTMNAARILRQAIPRPKVVPKFGQSTERFIIINSSEGPFRIPDTECNFSFLLVLGGSAVVDLNPAEECKHQCKTLRVELKETYLLWYNWWYWKPMVQTSSGNETLIAHVGSYC